MEDLELIHKKEKTSVEIEDNEINDIEIEDIPKTQEEIIEELENRNKFLNKINGELYRRISKYNEDLEWYERYMNEHRIDFERWKEDTIRREKADYEKYGAMRPEERQEYDERLEKIREAMRRRRAQK